MSHVTTHIIAIDAWAKKIELRTDEEVAEILLKNIHLCFVDPEEFEGAISSRLSGPRGSYYVIAGEFNHFGLQQGRELAQELSRRLRTQVLYQGYSADDPGRDSEVFNNGRPVVDKHS